MSFLVTRPPVPVPGISVISTPCSSARRRTTGEERVRRRVSASSISARPSPSARAAVRSLSLSCATGWASVPEAGNSSVGASAAVFSCGGASAAGESLSPARATSTISVPTSTVVPSETRNFSIVPATGEGSSALTLSVSTSAKGSSISTSSPSALSQRVMVPSVTLSPSCGIVTGFAKAPSSSSAPARAWPPLSSQPTARSGPSSALQKPRQARPALRGASRARRATRMPHAPRWRLSLPRKIRSGWPRRSPVPCPSFWPNRGSSLCPADTTSSAQHPGSVPCVFRRACGHLEGRIEHQAVGDDRDIRPLAVDAGLPEGDLVVVFWYVLLDQAVGAFVFEEEDGVGVADGALDHGLGVAGIGRCGHLEAWCIAEPGLDALGVIEGAARHDAVRRADGDRAVPVAVRAVVKLGCFVDDLVECRRDEVGELYLGHGAHPVHREAYGRANDQALRQRRVHHPCGPELLLQPLRYPENTTGPANILAEHHYRLVRAHLLGEPLVDGLEQILRRHGHS